MNTKEIEPTDPLSTQQRKALEALLTARTTREAAETSGTPERTLSRWLADEIFSRELAQAQREVLGGAIRGLAGTAAQAVQVLNEIVTDGATHPAQLRLAAADKTLSHMLNLKRAFDLEERIAELERENTRLRDEVAFFREGGEEISAEESAKYLALLK